MIIFKFFLSVSRCIFNIHILYDIIILLKGTYKLFDEMSYIFITVIVVLILYELYEMTTIYLVEFEY